MTTETEAQPTDLSQLHVEGIADVDLRHYLDPMEPVFQHMVIKAPTPEEAA